MRKILNNPVNPVYFHFSLFVGVAHCDMNDSRNLTCGELVFLLLAMHEQRGDDDYTQDDDHSAGHHFEAFRQRPFPELDQQ